ncbi:MAG TPA: hypothetical protein VMK12_18175 [Anaeromyxobacteraceae bacterium]|nr:hypothetical protein [Anaeromyxobacteraceae bacterium]
MTVVRTKTEHFLPWAWQKFGFRFDVTGATLDSNRPANVDLDRHLVDLDEPWERATLALRIEVSPDLSARVLPPKDKGGLAAVVVLRCDETRLRRGVRLLLPPGDGPLEHQIELTRAELSGTAELSVVVVRAVTAESPVRGFATAAGARLAETRPWELRVDRRRTLSGVYLDVRFKDFITDDVVPKEHKQNLYRLEISEHPVLWLNSAHASINGILNAKGHVGKRAILREVAYDLMVPVVWIRLFVHAAEQVRRGEETAYGWQEAVLDTAARLLHPKSKKDIDPRERLEAELEDLPALLERLDAALQAEYEVAKHLVRIAEELE